MAYFSEFMGSLILLSTGYAYVCNISLKKTLVPALNYIELVFAWSLAVGFGIMTATAMGGPAYLNPGVVLGNVIYSGLEMKQALLYLLMEFLAAGAAVGICIIFFWDSFQASGDVPKRGIFAAYPVERNLPLNVVQEVLATFIFFFVILTGTSGISNLETGIRALAAGLIGFGAVALLALSLNSTGYSMNAMRSVFSSVWFTILPIPNKGKEKVDWSYQLIVNLLGSSIGSILAVIATGYIRRM